MFAEEPASTSKALLLTDVVQRVLSLSGGVRPLAAKKSENARFLLTVRPKKVQDFGAIDKSKLIESVYRRLNFSFCIEQMKRKTTRPFS